MAFVDPDAVTRHHIPGEPGEWMDVRPLATRDVYGGHLDPNAPPEALAQYAKAIVAWSYNRPVTAENVGLLDLKTFSWLQDVVNVAAGMRPESEKNASSAASHPTTERDAAPSLTSSGI